MLALAYQPAGAPGWFVVASCVYLAVSVVVVAAVKISNRRGKRSGK